MNLQFCKKQEICAAMKQDRRESFFCQSQGQTYNPKYTRKTVKEGAVKLIL